ncbi:MAG: T9SS type A sorting domain-containing protein [Bacteroidia bacterium]
MKKILLSLFMLLGVHVFGQWIKLPTLILGPGGWSVPSVDIIKPIANGRIVFTYSQSGSPSSGSWAGIAESFDDLGTYRVRYGISGYGAGTRNFRFKDDSSFVFEVMGYGHLGLEYTYNDFKKNRYMSFCAPVNAVSLASSQIEITQSFVFSAIQRFPADSLVISRIPLNDSFPDNCATLYNYDGYGGKLEFVNDSVGHILCNSRTNLQKKVVLRTTDYGLSWNEIYTDSVSGIKSFHFPSENVGYVLAGSGMISKTIDGGNTWLPVGASLIPGLNCIRFSDDSSGFAGGNSGVLLHTTNSGNTWSAEVSNTTYPIYSLYTFPGNIAYFVDSVKAVYKNAALIPTPTPTVTVSFSTLSATCPGTKVVLTANGANTYKWSQNLGSVTTASVSVSPLNSTTYTVIGYVGSKSDTEIVTVNVVPKPILSFTPTSINACLGDSLVLKANGAQYYFWNADSLGFPYDTLAIKVRKDTTYTVKGYNQNCPTVTKSINVRLKDCTDYSEITIYPNPVFSQVTVKFGTNFSCSSIVIKNALGQDLFTFIPTDKMTLFDTSSLADGLYIVSFYTEDKVINRKLLLKRE